ncbi:MAG: hypothetical protein ACM3QY_04605 [Candidatus Levyibacteriota bacterium]
MPEKPSIDLTRPTPLEQDFSIVLGGPLFQALRRAHLTGDALQLLRRRIVVMTLFAWVPLLVLSAIDGKAWGSAVAVPFLYDIDAHARFLVALPLLIVAEIVVHLRMRGIVSQFVTLGLVPAGVRERFDAAIASATRLRNSMLAELLMIAAVYGIGILVIWGHYAALSAPTWYATPEGGRLRPELAGWWYLIVSLPVFQFLLVRWYFRLFVWARFLWQVSRMDIAYAPMHPDRNGGVGFLSRVGYAFTPLLLAQGTMLSGLIANKIFFEGAALPQFKLDIFAFVLVVVGAVLAPLLVFVVPLSRAKRNGIRDYGHLAKRYVDEFNAKWLGDAAGGGEPLVGSADVQSLADMGNSFEVVRGMRLVPVTRDTMLQLVVMALLPLVPLLLTMISLEELLGKLVRVIV